MKKASSITSVPSVAYRGVLYSYSIEQFRRGLSEAGPVPCRMVPGHQWVVSGDRGVRGCVVGHVSYKFVVYVMDVTAILPFPHDGGGTRSEEESSVGDWFVMVETTKGFHVAPSP